MQGQFVFLGTGGSMGVPVVGCACHVCTSSDPHNKRTRTAGLITVRSKRLLIDVGPDFRAQALRHGIMALDGVLLTHAHSDHVAGIDDLRAYYLMHGKALPCALSRETSADVKQRFPYLWGPREEGKSLPAQLDFTLLERDAGTFVFEEIPIHYFSYYQKRTKVTGYRIGSFAYVSDIRDYAQEIFSALEGVGIIVLSALRHEPTRMHFSLEEAIAFAQKVQAKTTYITHIGHEIEHEAVSRSLPSFVYLAHDGLALEFTA